MLEPKRRRDKLNEPDKGASRAQDILTRLWSNILTDLGIREESWTYLVRRYVEDPKNGVKQDTKSKSTETGNMDKALLADKMSWRSFHKGLRVLSYLLGYLRLEVHYRRPGQPLIIRGVDLIKQYNPAGHEGPALDDEEGEDKTSHQPSRPWSSANRCQDSSGERNPKRLDSGVRR